MSDCEIFGFQGNRSCTLCGTVFEVNTENFYTRTRENGRKYFTSKCKGCIKRKRAEYRANNPEAVAQSSAKTFEKNRAKYNAQRRRRFQENPDLRAAKQAATKLWLQNNADRMAVYRRAYRAEFADVIRLRLADYYSKNKDAFRVSRQVRKGRVRGAEGAFTVSDIRRQMSDQFGMCFWCRTGLCEDFHVDHYLPVSKGGTNKPYNIVLACPTCNISRGAKMPVEFFAYRKLIADQMPVILKKREYFRNKMRERRTR